MVPRVSSRPPSCGAPLHHARRRYVSPNHPTNTNMISEKHSAAARANGALSRGPKTPEGKARSARNALRHGLLANSVLLTGEDPERLRSLFEGYIERFQPQDDAEFSLVEQMVSATWRLNRATTIETHILDVAMAEKTGSPVDRLADGFGDLASTPKFSLIERYQTRLHLMHSRALRDLAMMRKKLPQPSPE